jgi:hypothetical protein
MYTTQNPLSKRTFRDRISIPRLRPKKPTNKQVVSIIDHNFRVPLQRFVIVPHETQSILGRLGTQVIFPANAFVYSSGAPVFEEVDVELKEVMTKRDAVRENLLTIINDTFQESGGMVYLNASCGGENVFLGPDTPAKIMMPHSQNVFLKGTDVLAGQRLKDERINWHSTNISLKGLAKQKNKLFRQFVNSKKNTDSTKGKITSFEFETGNLGWMNCDKPFSIPLEDTTELSINIQADQPVEMKVVLKDHNSVLPVFKNGSSYIAKVPTNEVATVTGFYQKGTYYFFGTKQKTGVQLNIKERTLKEIKKELKRL